MEFERFFLADLRHSEDQLSGSNWAGQTFEGADLRGLTVRNSDFTLCNFENADLRNTTFVNCSFESAMLENAEIDETTVFIRCTELPAAMRKAQKLRREYKHYVAEGGILAFSAWQRLYKSYWDLFQYRDDQDTHADLAELEELLKF